MNSVNAHESRRQRWGDEPPVDDDTARGLLLDAAERCYRRLGIERTRMDDIAAEAGVHRTTVYNYFPTKDAVLATAFVREADLILNRSAGHLDADGPFAERLVTACLVSLRETRRSQYMSLLLDPRSAGRTLHAAAASEAWQERAAQSSEPALRAAIQAGEVRDDLPVPTILRWVWRIAFSLVSEPPDPADGADEGVLRAFLLPCLRPQPLPEDMAGPRTRLSSKE